MRWRALRFSEDALRLRSPQAARPEWVSFPVTAAVLLCLFRLDPQSFSLDNYCRLTSVLICCMLIEKKEREAEKKKNILFTIPRSNSARQLCRPAPAVRRNDPVLRSGSVRTLLNQKKIPPQAENTPLRSGKCDATSPRCFLPNTWAGCGQLYGIGSTVCTALQKGNYN